MPENIIQEIRQLKIVDSRYEKFDACLDLNFGSTSVTDHHYDTSFVLKQIDYPIYKEGMIRWSDDLNGED